jgi:RNA polymerase sigma-70 factor (ECF subfamily)
MIRGAAAGRAGDREGFAKSYAPVIRAYLGARWRGTPLVAEIDDAVQDVFVDCFRDDGVLARAEEDRPGGFRAFFFGVVRNAALRVERQRARRRDRPADSSFDPDRLGGDEESLAANFDRAWATALLKQAGELQPRRARADGDGAPRRLELLRLRFEDGLPIREIASRWEEDPAHLHRQYAKARQEFRSALVEVVSFHHSGSRAEVIRECSRLLDLFR